MYYFYELTTKPLDVVIPKLIDKIYTAGERCMIYHPDEEFLVSLDSKLWTFGKDIFLPHGLAKDKTIDPMDQPVLLTSEFENLNDASVFMALNCFSEGAIKDIKKYYCVFEGQISQASEILSWKTRLSDQNNNIIYWKESSEGGWVKL